MSISGRMLQRPTVLAMVSVRVRFKSYAECYQAAQPIFVADIDM